MSDLDSIKLCKTGKAAVSTVQLLLFACLLGTATTELLA